MTARAMLMVLFVAGGAADAVGQTVIESTEGTSTLLFGSGTAGAFAVNFSQASTKAWYQFANTGTPWRFGVEGKLIASNGLVSLVEESFKAPPGSVSLTVGHEWEAGRVQVIDAIVGLDTLKMTPDTLCGCRPVVRETTFLDTTYTYRHTHWLWLRAGVQRGEFKLADVSDPVAPTATDTSHVGLSFAVFYNGYLELNNSGFPGQLLVGLSASYSDQNNYTALAKVEVCNLLASSASSSPGSVTSCAMARAGSYAESWLAAGGGDALWYWSLLQNRLIPGVLVRYDEVHAERRWSRGFGFFLTKSARPLDILGGAIVQHVQGRWKVGLQAGWVS